MTTLSVLVSNAQKVNDHKDVAKAVEALRIAMIEGKRESLAKIAFDDLSYGHSDGHVENKAEFIEKIVSGQSKFTTIDLSEQVIQVTGDVATVRHQFQAATANDGVPGTVNLHVLTVWVKRKGEWKLLARQAVKLAH